MDREEVAWIAKGSVCVISGEISSLRIEIPREDEDFLASVFLELCSGSSSRLSSREGSQVKSRKGTEMCVHMQQWQQFR